MIAAETGQQGSTRTAGPELSRQDEEDWAKERKALTARNLCVSHDANHTASRL
jgi:hypothetical protein